MGDLILMSRPTGSTRREPISGESAAILFFTGVRYYRMDDAAVSIAPRVRRRRKTDKTKLPCSIEQHA